LNDDLNKILTKITNGEYFSQNDLLPFLLLTTKEFRVNTNVVLAAALYYSGVKNNIEQAAIFIQRAWNLSGFDEDILPIYEKIHLSLNEVKKIKEAYKRLFIKNAGLKNFNNAGKYFNLWQDAYPIHLHLDKYEYDFDVIGAMTDLAEPFVLNEKIQNNYPSTGGKKLAYLVVGICEVNSVLLKIDLLFSKYHNKQKFEVVFFTLNTEQEVLNSAQGKNYLNILQKDNKDIYFADDKETNLDKIISLARKINDFNPDLIITDVALRNFDQYFLTLVLSKKKILCLNQGPPPQFVPPHVNWNIAWTKHPLIDSPVDGSLVPLEFEIFDGNEIHEFQKSELGIPDDSFVIVCAGRLQKFQNLDFWNFIGKVLDRNLKVYLLVVGIEENIAPDISILINRESKQRIKYFGWQTDYLRLLKTADLVFDTYPSGGGVVLIDSMVLGIPILFFNNDYMNHYDQTNWSPAEELIEIPELAVPRGDFDELLRRANEIILNKELRLSLGKQCREKIVSTKGNPLRMVQRCEAIYNSVIDNESEFREDFNTESDLFSGNIKNQLLDYENYFEWQKAYQDGYKSSMGDHSTSFYNQYFIKLGLYDNINNSNTIIEYGSGDAAFMKKVIAYYPSKKFYLTEITPDLINNLQTELSDYKNVEILLNHPEITSLSNIDLCFSFLLSQSMPKTLWKNHLRAVKSMLSKNGCYIFQFAFHMDGFADDQIKNGISGSNKYKPEEIYKMLEETGYSGCNISVPITLEKLNSDIIWYFCRAY
jgi:glycosyltransferase involved in cell wall biosynthesis